MKCCRCPLYHYWSNESDRGESCAIFGDGWDSPFQYEDKEGTIVGCYLDRHFIEKADAERDEYYESMAESIARDLGFTADTPQTDCETCSHYKLACELFSEVCKYEPTTQTETQNSNLTFDTPQTESTGSPIGDYRDGVGAWQTDRMTEEEFDTKLAKVLVGQTDCGWGEPRNE